MTGPRGEDSRTLQPGSRLGPYEIVSFLGAGGMGEIYRARDTRLGREVAIKVLPADLSSDRERLRRFEREARSASALNHPNIVTIHDIGVSDSVSYIAMELVEGESLRRLLERGSLRVKKLLSIAEQIADGLARAHEAGIVHRDLKPENVMVDKDGRVKILDFGLAKVHVRPSGPEQTSTPTETATEAGTVLGTVGYMSPEQVSGGDVDYRSDQFSLGAVLYEMTTGRRAFQKKTSVDTMSAILNDEPEPIAKINPQSPAPLRWIVERCLAKEPRHRYASTQDLAQDLQSVQGHLSDVSGSSVATAPRGRFRYVALATAAAVLASLVAVYFVGERRGLENAQIPTFQRLTFRRGGVLSARFTSDGRTVVYAASWDGAPLRLFTTRLENPESGSLALPDADLAGVSSSAELLLFPAWPYSYARSGWTLSRVPLAGGTPRVVAEGVVGADWSPVSNDMALVRWGGESRRLEYPAGRVLLDAVPGAYSPRVSRDGRRVAYYTNAPGRSVAVVDRSGKQQILSTGWRVTGNYLAWSPKGDEIWFTGSKRGWSAPLHAVSLSRGERTLLRLPGWISLQDVSAEGRVLLTYGESRNVTRCRLPGWERERDLSWFESSEASDLSANGEDLLFAEMGDATPAYTAYLRRTDGSPPQLLGKGSPLALSPDGKKVLAWDESQFQYLVLPTGAGEPRRLLRPQAESGMEYIDEGGWFPDSRRFLLVLRKDGDDVRSYAMDTETDKLEPLTPEGLRCGPLSLDGKSAVCDTPQGRRIYSFERKDAREVPGLDPAETVIQWSDDGNSLFVVAPDVDPTKVHRLEMATGRRQLWRELGPIDATGWVRQSLHIRMTPRGDSYCYTDYHFLQDLYAVEGLR